MKRTWIFALTALAVTSQANVFVNGGFASGIASFQTGVGNGSAGANTSTIDGVNFGFNMGSPNFRAADDFTVTAGGWSLNSMTIYSYQTGANLTNTFTGLTVAIYSAPPVNETDAPAFGSLTTNVLSSAVDTGVYRVTSTTLTDANRRVFALTANLSGINLAAGTYYAAVQAAGSASFSGPWFVPITPFTGQVGGSAMQAATGGAYANATDTFPAGVANTNMAFTITYNPVPEPASMTALGIGTLALIRRRRSKKA